MTRCTTACRRPAASPAVLRGGQGASCAAALRTLLWVALGSLGAVGQAHSASASYAQINQAINTFQGFVIAGNNGSGPSGGTTLTGSRNSFDEQLELTLSDQHEPTGATAALTTVVWLTTELDGSAISADGLAVMGLNVSGNGLARGEAQAVFSATFSLDEPALLTLSADVRCTLSQPGLDCLSSVVLEGGGPLPLLDLQVASGVQSGTFNFVLAAHTPYTVRSFAGSILALTAPNEVDATAQYLLRMDFAAVPEPATYALWAMGLAALLGRRRGLA